MRSKGDQVAIDEVTKAFAAAKKVLDDARLRVSTVRLVSTESFTIDAGITALEDAASGIVRAGRYFNSFLEDP